MNTAYKIKVYFLVCIACVFITAAPTFMIAEAEDVAPTDRSNYFYADYAAVLKAYVDDKGMVNYSRLQANRDRLDAFCLSLGKLDRRTYEKWGDRTKIAFWINAYNGLTLKVIIDHYPIKGNWPVWYPQNSIRRIPGVWDKLKFEVISQEMTLEDIEHNTLRAKFDEPRIHMALVCAALGCPPLRNEPYQGNKLDEQLDDQSKNFLSNPLKLKIDRAGGKVYLSKIFDWFGKDFIRKYEPNR